MTKSHLSNQQREVGLLAELITSACWRKGFFPSWPFYRNRFGLDGISNWTLKVHSPLNHWVQMPYTTFLNCSLWSSKGSRFLSCACIPLHHQPQQLELWLSLWTRSDPKHSHCHLDANKHKHPKCWSVPVCNSVSLCQGNWKGSCCSVSTFWKGLEFGLWCDVRCWGFKIACDVM